MKRNAILGLGMLSMTSVHAISWTPPQILSPTVSAPTNFNVFSCYDFAHSQLVATWGSSLSELPHSSTSTNDGATWNPALVISPSPLFQDVFPVYFPPNGSLVATWTGNAPTFDALSALSTDGAASWTTNPISTEVVRGADLFSAYDSKYQVLITAWGNGILAEKATSSVSSDGINWSTPMLINGSVVAYDVFLAYDPVHSTMMAAYKDGITLFPEVSLSTDGGNTWSAAPIVISTTPSTPTGPLDVWLTYMSNGVTIASWAAGDTFTPTYAISRDGGNTWGEQTQINASVFSILIPTAYNPCTDVLVTAWHDVNTLYSFYSLSFDGGMTWTTPAIIDTIPGVDSIGLTLDPVTGVFLATWIESIDGNLPVYARLAVLNPTKVSGNNLQLVNYLNNYAPFDTVSLFTRFCPGDLDRALALADPVRNAVSTFASQNGVIATSQALTDHLRERRFEKCFTCGCPGSFTAWATPYGQYTHISTQHQSFPCNTALGGLLFGFDWNGRNNSVLGAGGAYAHTYLHNGHHSGNANVDQGLVTLYGSLNGNPGYLDLSLWGGYYHIDNERKISFSDYNATAKSNTQGGQLAAHMEMGYDGFFCNGVEPFVLTDWVGNWEDGLREEGAINLNMGQKRRICSLVRSEGGFRLHQFIALGCGTLVLREKGAYAYQKAFHTGRLSAFLVGAPGFFTVKTLQTGQSLGVGELSVIYVPTNPSLPYMTLRYQGQFGSRFQSHEGMFEIGKSF